MNGMKKYGLIGWFCALLLAGCLPVASPPTPSALSSAPTPEPRALVVNEYLLRAPPDISTEQLVFHFAAGDQKGILARTEAYRDYRTQAGAYNSRILSPFGYTLKDYQRSDTSVPHSYSFVYRGDEMIAREVIFMKPISVNAAGTDFIGEVDLFDGTYLFTRDNFEKRRWPPGREPYLYVGDQLLSMEISSIAHRQIRVGVYLDDSPVYQSRMFAARATYGITDGPWSYNGHWALVMLDGKPDAHGNDLQGARVILDGQDLNTMNGYEQSFQFAVLGERPFFFYQRDGRIGISFDGREMAENYDEIPHYNCCSSAQLNPRVSMNMIWFLARRGRDWYYVEAYIPPP